MLAVVTTGNGGFDRLDVREVRRPQPDEGEVLVQVLAAGVNTTEINTRLGWYSASVGMRTGRAAELQEAHATERSDGGWDAPTPFPFIQGTDCCGRVVEVGARRRPRPRGTPRPRPALHAPPGFASLDTVWMGSDFDGAFAQFVRVPASEVFPVTAP